jgi:hypothetical protein
MKGIVEARFLICQVFFEGVKKKVPGLETQV